jgi:tight adherence protein B
VSAAGSMVPFAFLVFVAAVLAGAWRRAAAAEGVRSRLVPSVAVSLGEGHGGRASPVALRVHPWRTPLASAALGLAGALLGFVAVPGFGPFLGGAAGVALPVLWRRRATRGRADAVERELAELVSATALALRSGQSIAQALEFAGSEVGEPLRGILGECLTGRRLGTSLDEALSRFADRVGTGDVRMFVVVIAVQARSGGNLAAALEEVARTIRHRISVRRELRAMSAQGRLSGLILGLLPIAFFVVLGITSRAELEPVYRSAPGMALVLAGLGLQGLAYLWIRHLLRVEG